MSAIMKLMASKLGLREETAALSKACEFERLLKVKMSGTSNLNDYARAITCLDIATDCLGIPFDTELAIKLSALKKSQYANSKHNVKKILDLETELTINSLCVQLGCSQVSSLAANILDTFQSDNVKLIDINHPQYTCMAVYQACRLDKVKVAKNKFIPPSHLKPSQWSELEMEWTKFVDQLVANGKINVNNKKQSAVGKTVAQKICDNVQVIKHKNKEKKRNNDMDKIEEYETWKARVLELAARELEANNVNVITIAKSEVLKTTPKIDREKGVRLLLK